MLSFQVSVRKVKLKSSLNPWRKKKITPLSCNFQFPTLLLSLASFLNILPILFFPLFYPETDCSGEYKAKMWEDTQKDIEVFCIWLISLRIMSLSFIHIVCSKHQTLFIFVCHCPHLLLWWKTSNIFHKLLSPLVNYY